MAEDSPVRVLQAQDLGVQLDPGSRARYWSVALSRAQLTWFEVPPHGHFAMHRHESEQITLVLEGELVFELADGTRHVVGAGGVIALPGQLAHAVSAGDQGARAVDAWSPPRADLDPGAAGRTAGHRGSQR